MCDGIAGIFKCTREKEAFYLKNRKVRDALLCVRAPLRGAWELAYLTLVSPALAVSCVVRAFRETSVSRQVLHPQWLPVRPSLFNREFPVF